MSGVKKKKKKLEWAEPERWTLALGAFTFDVKLYVTEPALTTNMTCPAVKAVRPCKACSFKWYVSLLFKDF